MDTSSRQSTCCQFGQQLQLKNGLKACQPLIRVQVLQTLERQRTNWFRIYLDGSRDLLAIAAHKKHWHRFPSSQMACTFLNSECRDCQVQQHQDLFTGIFSKIISCFCISQSFNWLWESFHPCNTSVEGAATSVRFCFFWLQFKMLVIKPSKPQGRVFSGLGGTDPSYMI